jgi:hypothetical protein
MFFGWSDVMNNTHVVISSKRCVWKVLCWSTRLLLEVSDPTTLRCPEGCGYHFLPGSSCNLKVEAIVPELTTSAAGGGGGQYQLYYATATIFRLIGMHTHDTEREHI